MDRLHTAQVVRSLAASWDDRFLDEDDWPKIATSLLACGCDWPAVADLAAAGATSGTAVPDAVERLAAQAGREIGDLPVPAFWDTVCGLVARAWRLGVFDEVDAMYRLDGLWWMIRRLDRSDSQGLQMIWQGMGIKEMHDHCDISGLATALLIEADRLIPADSVNGPLCLAVLDALI